MQISAVTSGFTAVSGFIRAMCFRNKYGIMLGNYSSDAKQVWIAFFQYKSILDLNLEYQLKVVKTLDDNTERWNVAMPANAYNSTNIINSFSIMRFFQDNSYFQHLCHWIMVKYVSQVLDEV